MSILTGTGLSKHYGTQDVFGDVNLALAQGERVGLVGANGTGKSTLLRILVGLEMPSSGQVFRARSLGTGYLPQEVTMTEPKGTLWEEAQRAFDHLRQQASQLQEMEESLAAVTDPDQQQELLERYGQLQHAFTEAGGYAYEYRIRQVLGGLGFDQKDYHYPMSQLSGGQQTRAHLARLLLTQPDILFLDEPTNHLDLASVEWLEEYLLTWSGAMIIVAHDRYFLDKVTTRIWDMENGGLQHYRGNYSAYLQQRADRRERQSRQHRRQQMFIAKEEDFIQRNLAGQRTREAQGRRKRLARLERVDRVVGQKHLHLKLDTDLRSGDMVLATHDLSVGYQPDSLLFRCPDLEIQRGERVALLGPNGTGKTTFVKTILRQLNPLGGSVRIGAAVEIAYFAQAHAGLDPGQTVLEEVLSVKNLPLGEARNYLGTFLFSGDDIFKRIEDLSGGERARVALAKLALRGANFLVLDEPTNHLDIPSQEILQEVLGQFPGTILLVSHDRYFVDALASQVWALERGKIFVSKGGYRQYLAAREERRQAANPAGAPSPDRESENGKSNGRAGSKGGKKPGHYRRQQKLAELESAIEITEARLSELAAALEEASQSQAVERLRELGQDYKVAEEQLAGLFEQWAEVEEAV